MSYEINPITGNLENKQFWKTEGSDLTPKRRVNLMIPDGKFLKTKETKVKEVGAEILENHDFTDWNFVELPEGYEVFNAIDRSVNFEKTTKSDDGYDDSPYSLSLETYYELPLVTGFDWLSDLVTFGGSVGAGVDVDVRVTSKLISGNTRIGVVMSVDTDTTELTYNFDSSTWEDVPVPTADHIFIIEPTENFASVDLPTITTPANTEDIMGMLFVASEDAGGTALIGEMHIELDEVPVQPNSKFENWVELGDFEDPLINWTADVGDLEYGGIEIYPELDGSDNVLRIDIIGGDQTDNEKYILWQMFEGNADNLVFSIENKVEDLGFGGSGIPYILFLNGTPDDYTQMWNFDSDSWVTLTEDFRDRTALLSADVALELNDSDTYVTTTVNDLVMPDSGKISFVLVNDSQKMSYSYKNLTFTGDTENEITMFKVLNPSVYADMGADDLIFAFYGDGGAEKILSLNALGEFESLLPKYEFDKPVFINSRVLGKKGDNVTAANEITLGDANFFLIDGETDIHGFAVDGWTAGSRIVFRFVDGATVKHDEAVGEGFATIYTSTGSDYVAGSGAVLELLFDGVRWVEISRG